VYGFAKNQPLNTFDILGLFEPGTTTTVVCVSVTAKSAAAAGTAATAATGATVVSVTAVGAAIAGCGYVTYKVCYAISESVAPYVFPDPPDLPAATPPRPRIRPVLCMFERYGNPFKIGTVALEHGGTDSKNCVYKCSDNHHVFIPCSDRYSCPYSVPPMPVPKLVLLAQPGAWTP
jgi:hypothetical protein